MNDHRRSHYQSLVLIVLTICWASTHRSRAKKIAFAFFYSSDGVQRHRHMTTTKFDFHSDGLFPRKIISTAPAIYFGSISSWSSSAGITAVLRTKLAANRSKQDIFSRLTFMLWFVLALSFPFLLFYSRTNLAY